MCISVFFVLVGYIFTDGARSSLLLPTYKLMHVSQDVQSNNASICHVEQEYDDQNNPENEEDDN